MKNLLKAVIIYAVFIMQGLIFERVKVFSCSPDLLLTVIVIYSVSMGAMEAAFLGAFAGVLTDAFYGHIFGVNTLIYMYFALLISLAVDKKTDNSPLLMGWVCFVSISVLEIVLAALKAMFGYDISLGFTGAQILVKGIFGALFTLGLVILKQRKVRKQKSVS